MNQAVLFSGWGKFVMVGNGCRTRRQCVFVSTDHTYSKAHLQCLKCHVPLPLLVNVWKLIDQQLFTTWLLERINMQRSRRGTPWHCCREIRSQALHTSLLGHNSLTQNPCVHVLKKASLHIQMNQVNPTKSNTLSPHYNPCISLLGRRETTQFSVTLSRTIWAIMFRQLIPHMEK